MDGWNTTFLLGRPIFRGYVSFREGIWCLDSLTRSFGQDIHQDSTASLPPKSRDSWRNSHALRFAQHLQRFERFRGENEKKHGKQKTAPGIWTIQVETVCFNWMTANHIMLLLYIYIYRCFIITVNRLLASLGTRQKWTNQLPKECCIVLWRHLRTSKTILPLMCSKNIVQSSEWFKMPHST